MDIQVKVFEGESSYGQKDWPSEKATEFIKWFQNKVDLIPSEYRDKAVIELTSSTVWDSSVVDLTISYTRPETIEEQQAREFEAIRRQQQQESTERQTLTYLRSKYGDQPK